jgi:hypothetical protein
MKSRTRNTLFALMAVLVLASPALSQESAAADDPDYVEKAHAQETIKGVSGPTCEEIMKTCKTSRAVDCATQYKACTFKR